nr:DExH-box ATP-dependent RNA helicase DExH11 isoform X2 [Ipomoea batatas]
MDCVKWMRYIKLAGENEEAQKKDIRKRLEFQNVRRRHSFSKMPDFHGPEEAVAIMSGLCVSAERAVKHLPHAKARSGSEQRALHFADICEASQTSQKGVIVRTIVRLDEYMPRVQKRCCNHGQLRALYKKMETASNVIKIAILSSRPACTITGV